jgi:hypothetical protein
MLSYQRNKPNEKHDCHDEKYNLNDHIKNGQLTSKVHDCVSKGEVEMSLSSNIEVKLNLNRFYVMSRCWIIFVSWLVMKALNVILIVFYQMW